MDLATKIDYLPELDLEMKEQRLKEEVFKLPQARIDVIHKFEDGKYIREMHAAAGTCVIGAKHRFPTFNVFVKGRGYFKLPDGSMKEMEAPVTFISEPGSKIVYVTEDLVWQNWWPTDIKDIEVLETMLFEQEPLLVKQEFETYCLSWDKNQADREDYVKALADLGLSQEEVSSQVNNLEDQIELPYGDYKVRIGTSAIEGRGVLATADINEGEAIGIARAGIFRTPLGRFINHSATPNAEGEYRDGNIVVVALRHIKGSGAIFGQGEEITVDYRKSVGLSRSIGE